MLMLWCTDAADVLILLMRWCCWCADVVLMISVFIVITVTKVIVAFMFKLLSRTGVCSKSGLPALRIVIGRYGYKSSFGANKVKFGCLKKVWFLKESMVECRFENVRKYNQPTNPAASSPSQSSLFLRRTMWGESSADMWISPANNAHVWIFAKKPSDPFLGWAYFKSMIGRTGSMLEGDMEQAGWGKLSCASLMGWGVPSVQILTLGCNMMKDNTNNI